MLEVTRTFTRAELDELDVQYEDVSTSERPTIVLAREQVDTDRWTSTHDVVFRAPDDGQTWMVSYQRGLTEYQEGIDPWFGDEEITADLVEAREVTVTRWLPVEATDEGDN